MTGALGGGGSRSARHPRPQSVNCALQGATAYLSQRPAAPALLGRAYLQHGQYAADGAAAGRPVRRAAMHGDAIGAAGSGRPPACGQGGRSPAAAGAPPRQGAAPVRAGHHRRAAGAGGAHDLPSRGPLAGGHGPPPPPAATLWAALPPLLGAAGWEFGCSGTIQVACCIRMPLDCRRRALARQWALAAEPWRRLVRAATCQPAVCGRVSAA